MNSTFLKRSVAILSFCTLGGVVGIRIVEARKAVDAEVQKRITAAISQGRKLAEQSKYPEAIAAFQSALTLMPTTARALSELGLTYYRMKQYPEGESAMRRALKATSEPGQRGRSLYNLGLILEAKGDSKGAVVAYKESLTARSNQVVLERLRKLDAAAAAALDPVTPRSFSGPFPTIKDTCKALNDCKERAAEEINPGGLNYFCQHEKPLARLAKPATPYKSVQLIEALCASGTAKDPGDSDSRSYLIVQSEKGFFATSVGGKIASEQINTFSDFTVRELRLTAGPAGAQRIFLRFEETGGHDVGEGSDAWESEKLVIAGIGKSGIPSATPPLLIRSQESEDPGATSGDDAKVTVRVDAKLTANLVGDELELTPASSVKAVAKAHLAPTGKQNLVFP